jgi:type VI secretion system protein ImpC
VFGILANFSGGFRAPELAARRFVEVDRDTLDAAMRRLEPEIELGLPFCRTLRFSCWDDFHPDSIAERVPALRKLLDARSEVARPEAMQGLLDEAGISVSIAEDEPGAPPAPQAEPVSTPPGETDQAALLDSIVSNTDAQPRPATRSRVADPQLEQLIQEITDSSTDTDDYDLQERWRAAIDRELTTRVCAILHHPAFRSLEASWRPLRALVRQTETGEQLRIRLLDLRRDEILADAGESAKLSTSQLHRLIYEGAMGTPGEEPLDTLLTDLELGDGEEDLRVLAHLGALAETARAPLLAAASASLCEAEEGPSQGWRELRRSPPGRWLGLCYPRVLLRLPYGPETESVERFEFDESRDAAGELSYLWGSAALTLGIAAARALAAEGTLDALPRFARLEGLPFHVFREADQVQSRGPTEVLLTESRIRQLVELGIIPLAAIAGQDAAQLVAFRSISGDSFLGR